MLKGEADRVSQLAEQVITERGVRYGKLILVPDNTGGHEHSHHGHSHSHHHHEHDVPEADD